MCDVTVKSDDDDDATVSDVTSTSSPHHSSISTSTSVASTGAGVCLPPPPTPDDFFPPLADKCAAAAAAAFGDVSVTSFPPAHAQYRQPSDAAYSSLCYELFRQPPAGMVRAPAPPTLDHHACWPAGLQQALAQF